jgi:hypothetical protein
VRRSNGFRTLPSKASGLDVTRYKRATIERRTRRRMDRLRVAELAEYPTDPPASCGRSSTTSSAGAVDAACGPHRSRSHVANSVPSSDHAYEARPRYSFRSSWTIR